MLLQGPGLLFSVTNLYVDAVVPLTFLVVQQSPTELQRWKTTHESALAIVVSAWMPKYRILPEEESEEIRDCLLNSKARSIIHVRQNILCWGTWSLVVNPGKPGWSLMGLVYHLVVTGTEQASGVR